MSEAPRWRLITGHYLKVPELPDGTMVEWEHKETNRANGRTVRKLYAVPILLDPNDPADHNYPGSDGIVVAHMVEGARNERNDYIFEGDPTPEMEPMNEAAEAISESLKEKWTHPIDTLPVNGGMNSAEQAFMQKMMEGFAKQIGASLPTANTSVPAAELESLKAELAELRALIAAKPAGETSPVRRV